MPPAEIEGRKSDLENEVLMRRWVSRFCVSVLVASLVVIIPRAALAMPLASVNFTGMGNATTPTIIGGDPPDTSGAVGPNDYVQMVNTGYEVFSKAGAVLQAAKLTDTLWSGYVGFNPGNSCSTRNDGEAKVRYDRMADRWVMVQASVPSFPSGPSYECVAVSKTPDPTGGFWLYDFKFTAVALDAKLGVWPDAYYVTFDLYGTSSFLGVEACAWNRAAMLAGQTETSAFEQCFTGSTSYFGLLPADLDGSLPPPAGSPEYLVSEAATANTLDTWKLHIDWSTPANSTFTGPATLTTQPFTDACTTCIPQPGTTQQLASMAGLLMYRLAYRNFGDHEALVVTHTVTGTLGTAIRWYELRVSNQTLSIFQQGTYAPDGNYRWLGAIAQDQAGDMALGFNESNSATLHPSIAWAGRLPTDSAGAMGQTETEAIIDVGSGNETGSSRWGYSSSMTVDPSDDCTFWFSTELYDTTGQSTWDTRIASVKFANCGTNDFSINASPSSVSTAQGTSTSTTITTTLTRGVAQNVVFNATGLPVGATFSFTPTSATAGNSSMLQLSAGPSTPIGVYTITVSGTATSAYHATTVTFTVTGLPRAGVSQSTTPAAPPARQAVHQSSVGSTPLRLPAAQLRSVTVSAQAAPAVGGGGPTTAVAGSAWVARILMLILRQLLEALTGPSG